MAAVSPYRLCFIGLGANLGDRLGNIRWALGRLAAHPGMELATVSPAYETEPVGFDSPHLFVNAVAALETELAPGELMEILMGLERELGRERSKGMDRPLDLDILAMEGVNSTEGPVILPHPRISSRLFVLEPWADIAPEFLVEPLGKRVRELLQELKSQGGEVPLRRIVGEALL